MCQLNYEHAHYWQLQRNGLLPAPQLLSPWSQTIREPGPMAQEAYTTAILWAQL